MLKKRFFKTKDTCKVTFQLPEDIDAESALVAGDFNGWDAQSTPMKKVKGTWKVTWELKKNREFQYRYLVNNSEWHNDWYADKYVPNNVDGDNSVVVTVN